MSDEYRYSREREHNLTMDELDRLIAEDADPEVQRERSKRAAARKRWDLPPVRLRPGVPEHRLTEQERAFLDRCGY